MQLNTILLLGADVDGNVQNQSLVMVLRLYIFKRANSIIIVIIIILLFYIADRWHGSMVIVIIIINLRC